MEISKLVFATLLVIAPLSSAEVLPLDDFVRHGDYLDLVISPDGKHLAARVRDESRVVLLFLRTGDMEAVGGVTPGSKNEVHSVTWVNNERVVYQLAETYNHLDAPVAYRRAVCDQYRQYPFNLSIRLPGK